MANNERPRGADGYVLEMVEGMSPSVGKLVLDEYQNIPFTVKDAVEDFYDVLSKASDRDSIDEIKMALQRLADTCDANPSYKEIYEIAKKEARNEIADVIANEGMALFGEEEKKDNESSDS